MPHAVSIWALEGAAAVAVLLVGLLAAVGLAGWALEVRSPRRIAWQDVVLQGIAAQRADGLVLQHETPGVVWATFGYAVYRSRSGGPFEREFVIRPRVGQAWAGYLRMLRKRYGYLELVELLPLREDLLVAFAGGDVHRIDLATGRADKTHSLRYFGRGRGRGLMAFGLTADASGTVYYAEYPRSGLNPVGVWRSGDEGRSWELACEFAPGFVRHLHAVQVDPEDRIWVAAGDRDEEARIGVSTDRAESFTWVGHGSQDYRACSLLFFPGVVTWGMDADFTQNRTLSLDRASGAVRVATDLPDAAYYAQVVDETTGLLGLAQAVAAVWVTRPDGTSVPWLEWDVPETPPPLPPGVRLARGAPSDAGYVHVSPLRTATDEAAVYRIPREALPSV